MKENADIVGQSSAIRSITKQIEQVAPTSATVLITGESGTGKELVARAIHDRSRRRANPLVVVNCAAIPAGLFESEFFGHARGAFTGASDERLGRFELADGGTLVLDEVGEVPLALQGKLLRVLQEGSFERVGESRTRDVDVRVVAADNRDLAEASRSGAFRLDLYYRLSVFPISIPPLRERPEDIRPLAEHYLRRACRRLGFPVATLRDEDVALLENHSWPGNVRELQNVIERSLIAGGGHLRLDVPTTDADHVPRGSPMARGTLSLADLVRLERQIIVRELDRTGWHIYGPEGAAARLGVPATTLASRIKRLGIAREPRDGTAS